MAKEYKRPSDDELRRRQYTVDDPHDQPNLAPHIPEGVGIARIVNTYRYPLYPKQKAYCAKCGAFRHRDGFTAELDDDTWALLGSKCGAELWGETWEEATARFKDEVDRAGLVRDFDRVLPELRTIRAMLDTWAPAVKKIAPLQGRFSYLFDDLWTRLRQCANRPDESLVRWQRVRDHAAEADFERRYGRAPEVPFYTGTDVAVASLGGADFFRLLSPEQMFGEALEFLDTAIAVGNDTQSHGMIKLRRAKVSITEARDRLDRVWSLYSAMIEFFRPDNLTAVVSWANQTGHQEHRYFKATRAIRDNSRRELQLPHDMPTLDQSPLQRLRRLI